MPELAVSYLYWTQQGLSDVAGILQLAAQVEAPPRVERNASGCRTTKPSRPPDLWLGSGRRHFRAACGSFLADPSPPLQQGWKQAGWHSLLPADGSRLAHFYILITCQHLK